MKENKNSLFKISLIVFVAIVFLSWIIPVGEYKNGVFTLGEITPVGIFDLPLIPLTVLDLALPTIIFIIMVSGFYGVVNKTGAYSKMINHFVNKLKGKEIKFLIFITILFGILSSIVGLNVIFFFIIPFVSTILLLLGFDKITAMLATFGSVIVGMTGSIYGTDISYYLNGYFGYNSKYSYNTSIFPDKIILLILLLFLLVMFVLKLGRKNLKNKKSNNEIIPFYEKNDNSKKSWVPLLIIFIISFIIMIVGSFKWDNVLNTGSDSTPFLSLYEKIQNIKIGNFPIVSNILGTIPAIGYWQLPFISVLILFMTIIIAVIYRKDLNEFLEGFGNGVKSNLKLVLYIIGANFVLAVLFKNGATANIATTMINYLMNLTDTFNSLILSITTIISSFFFNSFSTLIGTLYTPTVVLTGTTVELRFLATLIIQTLYGLVMFIAPTSVLLMLGLSYFNISYKEWFKNIWKLLLQLFIVVVLIIIIVTIFSL